MKRFLFLLGALFIMQTISLITADDIVWIKQTHDVKYVQFSPDSKMIATNNNGQVLIHDVETQETLFEYNPILKTRFTPDGKYLVGYFNTKELILIDMDTKKRKENIQPAPSGILFYDISSDGKKIIASYDQKYEFSIWDIESGQIERTVVFHPDDTANTLWMDILNIHYGKDDKTIIYTRRKAVPAPGPELRKIYSSTHIIDAVTGEELFKLNKSGTLTFSNNKTMIAEHGLDKNVSFRLVNSENWDVILSVPGLPSYVHHIEFSPDDKFLVYSGGNRIVIYDILKKESFYIYDHGTSYASIDVSNDGKYIASGVSQYLFLLNAKFGSTSVQEPINVKDITTYPNPSNSNSITVEFNLLNSDITEIQLYDLSGRIVRNIENKFLNAGIHKYEIDINGLSNGQYNLIIENKSRKISHKILINR